MTTVEDDDLWAAIGDPTRRRMLDILVDSGTGTATSLSKALPVSRQAVAKHLALLQRVGLVQSATAGRERLFEVDTAQLRRAAMQLATVGSGWDRRLSRIAVIAEEIGRTKQQG